MTAPIPPPGRTPQPTAGDVLRSLLFYLVFYTGTMVMQLAAALLLPLTARLAVWVPDRWSNFQRWCVTRILRIEVRVEGALPRGPVLVVVKHESFFEAIDMPTLLPRPAVFAKAELMRLPVWGMLARRYGLVAVERAQGARALRTMVTAARRLVAQGRVLVIFAEGTRVAHGARPPLQAGFAGLYTLIGLPVVAVAVDSGPLYHRWWKCAGTITYRFAEPIPAGLPREVAEARVHAAINALNPTL